MSGGDVENDDEHHGESEDITPYGGAGAEPVEPGPGPPPAGEQLAAIEAYYASWYSGPIAHPGMAKGWEDLVPGAANRILMLAENEQGHRHDMDRRALRAFSRGQWFAFAIGMTALLVGGGLALLDKDAIAIATILSALALLAGAFIWGRRTLPAAPEFGLPPDVPGDFGEGDEAAARAHT